MAGGRTARGGIGVAAGRTRDRAAIGVAAGRGVLVLLGYVAAVAGLAWASAGPWDQLRRPGAASFDTLLTITAAAGAWVCLVWLTLGFAVTVLAALPTTAGRWCAAASARIAPAAVRRLACVVLGGAVISGTGLAGTLPASAARSPGAPVATTVLPDLDRPAAGSMRYMGGPRLESSRAATSVADPQPGSYGAAASARTKQPSSEVVVRRGDTLWGIAARHMRPDPSCAEIAAEWPRWYEANRPVVGEDADLILPGQRLRAPAPADTSKEAR
jgi:LysM repeat protein